jgi:anti-sigma B factor antagonist
MSAAEPLEAPGSESFEVRRLADADGVVLMLAGELDLASAPALEQQLKEVAQANPARLLLDLRNLRFMDSTGLALMIEAQQSANANGHRLAFRRGTSQVQRLFELSGVLERFTFED